MLFGKPRDINDPSIFHSISLIPFLAWVGLGVDGLSSCAYGPDESFRALFNLRRAITGTGGVSGHRDDDHGGRHFVVLQRPDRALPLQRRRYGVATKLLGSYFGLVSGCALLVDYVLTITTSIASSVDQVFNVFPPPRPNTSIGNLAWN